MQSVWAAGLTRRRGIGGPARRILYPVDLNLIVARAGLLGMTDAEMRSKLHLLRGAA
jgi:hypothetical protein